MRHTQSHRQHVERAVRWAEELQGVERNLFLSLLSDFLADPRSEVTDLKRLLTLLKAGRGGHLKRSDSFGEQARIVCNRLPPLLDQNADLSGKELRAVLGWTARLLLTRNAHRRGGPKTTPPLPPKEKFGGLGGKQKGMLGALHAELKRKEEGDA